MMLIGFYLTRPCMIGYFAKLDDTDFDVFLLNLKKILKKILSVAFKSKKIFKAL